MKNLLKMGLTIGYVFLVPKFIYLLSISIKQFLGQLFFYADKKVDFISLLVFIILIIFIILIYKSFSFIIEGVNIKDNNKIISGILMIIVTTILLVMFIDFVKKPNHNDLVLPVTPCVPSLENNNCE